MRDDLDIPYPAMGNVQGSDYMPRDYRGVGRMDPNTRRLAFIAGGIGVSLLVLMGVWSVTGHKRVGVPVIEADSRPVREKPLNRGGLQVSGADETILSGDTEGKAVVAPAPESPAIAALKATPVQSTQAPTVLPDTGSGQSATRVGGLDEVPAPGPLNASRPAPPKPPTPAPAQKLATTVKPVAPIGTPAAPLAAAAPTGKAQVQLAAVGSEEAAMGEWQRLSHRYPDLLGARRPAVTKTEHDGKTFFRLRVSGFVDMASASAFCGQLKSRGGTCAPASF